VLRLPYKAGVYLWASALVPLVSRAAALTARKFSAYEEIIKRMEEFASEVAIVDYQKSA
jgi:hypothetical protein